MDFDQRLPVFSIYHDRLSSRSIELACREAGFLCRFGTFLSTDKFLQNYGISEERGGLVRLSLTHYSSLADVQKLLDSLYSLPGWFSGSIIRTINSNL